ncbi:MAG: helix-turn-helix transcriptional regulator [bacterium]|nr:helix-turn-helix transcriptional regulator [bacterium]
MFRNLEAEQARKGKTNSDMAELLGMSRNSYENKKRSGKFSVSQIFILCRFFDSAFEYLFATE